MEDHEYIEYPKILSQPESDPEALVADALEQFLSRNEVKGHKVAISLPGQSGLARFFKPPPVEAKKIPTSSSTKPASRSLSSWKR